MRYKERNEVKRECFIQELEQIKKTQKDTLKWNIIYIDESWIDHNEIKSRSWSPIWKPVLSEQYWYRYKRTTFLAWVRWDTVLAPMRFEWCTDTDTFNAWVEKFLCSELNEWDVVILDNASFHKSEKTRILIESKRAKLLYLPPYSPDLNPIENYWALLKLYVRKYNTTFEIFYDILDEFLKKEKWLYAS